MQGRQPKAMPALVWMLTADKRPWVAADRWQAPFNFRYWREHVSTSTIFSPFWRYTI